MYHQVSTDHVGHPVSQVQVSADHVGYPVSLAYVSVDHVGYPVSYAQVHPLDSSVLRMWEQMLPTGLLSCEESMVFIIDLGASRTLTFEQRNFVPGISNCMLSHQY